LRKKLLATFILILITLSIVAFLPASAIAASDDWPMYNHDPAHSGASSGSAPLSTPEVIWNFTLTNLPKHYNYANFYTPIVVDNRVYVPSDEGIWALEGSNGKVLWNTGRKGLGSLAIDSGILYSSLHGSAFNASTGALLWNTTVAEADVLAVCNGYFYSLSDDGKFVCRDATTGKQVWVSDVVPYYSCPAIDNELVYFGTYEGVVALNAYTGTQVWESILDGWVNFSPAVSSGLVFAGTDSHFYCLNASTGKEIWNYPTEEILATSSVFDGYVYVNSINGNLNAFNALTGEKIWNYSTCTIVREYPHRETISTPAIANGAVYVYSNDGNLYAFDAHSGDKLWAYTVEDPPPIDYVSLEYYASPVIANGKIFLTTFDHLFAFESKPVVDSNSPLLLPVLVSLSIIMIVCVITIVLFTRAKHRHPKSENAKS